MGRVGPLGVGDLLAGGQERTASPFGSLVLRVCPREPQPETPGPFPLGGTATLRDTGLFLGAGLGRRTSHLALVGCAVAFRCPAHLLERAACPGDGRSASASQGSPGTARPSRAQPAAGAGGRRRARPLPRGTRRSEGGLVPRGQTGSLPELPASASGGGGRGVRLPAAGSAARACV